MFFDAILFECYAVICFFAHFTFDNSGISRSRNFKEIKSVLGYSGNMFFTQNSKKFQALCSEVNREPLRADARLVLHKIKRTACRTERRADLEFFRLCSVYRLVPKFLKFILHNSNRQNLRQASALRRKVISAEIKSHRTQITKSRSQPELRGDLFKKIGFISAVNVKRVLEQKQEGEVKLCTNRYQGKLHKLGLSSGQYNQTNTKIHNLSV